MCVYVLHNKVKDGRKRIKCWCSVCGKRYHKVLGTCKIIRQVSFLRQLSWCYCQTSLTSTSGQKEHRAGVAQCIARHKIEKGFIDFNVWLFVKAISFDTNAPPFIYF